MWEFNQVHSLASHFWSILAASEPARPQNLMLSGERIFQSDSVTVTLQWDPSPKATAYVITLSDSSFTTSSTSQQLSNVPYNVPHTVNVVASNCVGNSTASVFMFQIGKGSLFM